MAIEIGKLYRMAGPDFIKSPYNPKNVGHQNWKRHMEKPAGSLICMPIAMREEDETVDGVTRKIPVALCYIVGCATKEKPLINGKDISFLGIPLDWLCPVESEDLGDGWFVYNMPAGQFIAEDGFQKKKLAEVTGRLSPGTMPK